MRTFKEVINDISLLEIKIQRIIIRENEILKRNRQRGKDYEPAIDGIDFAYYLEVLKDCKDDLFKIMNYNLAEMSLN